MADEDDFLRRWSRRKAEARQPAREAPPDPKPAAPPAEAGQAQPAPEAAKPAPLPPVESLNPDSDFSPFMASEVDPELRSKALKTLFSDPHFNTMDMLDVYVDDYSRPDPLPEGWLEKLRQVSRLGDAAGRDREEAERQRLARAAQEAGEPADGEKAEQMLPPSGEGTHDSDAAEGGMPPPSEGESGT